jgi:hypothetical protein
VNAFIIYKQLIEHFGRVLKSSNKILDSLSGLFLERSGGSPFLFPYYKKLSHITLSPSLERSGRGVFISSFNTVSLLRGNHGRN